MKYLLTAFFLSLGSFTSLAAQAAEPMYSKDAPKTFCESGKTLNEKNTSCADNGVFLTAADKCWQKVLELEKNVTQELESRIGGNIFSQGASFQKSRAAYEESSTAMAYQLAVTHLALKEVDAYFDYVNYPDQAETDEEIMAEACYRDVVVPMDELADRFEQKAAELAGKIETADNMAEQLSGHDTDLSNVGGAATAGAKKPSGKAKSAAPPKGPDWRASDITGTEKKSEPKKEKK